jgi:hypothetical protein
MARPGFEVYGPLAYLPALDLENALHRVFVHIEQTSNGTVTEGGLLLDQDLNRHG